MKSIHLAILGSGLLATTAAVGSITIDTVFVGNAGNVGNSAIKAGSTRGSVDYNYFIGIHEVTNGQYASFLNAVASSSDNYGLYNPEMGSSSFGGITRSGSGSFSYSAKSGWEDKPVNYVSFWDAARFTNWLTTGNTETGVYDLGGVPTPANDTITRDATAWANGGVAIASENEWYKAAYYDPTLNGGTGGYWEYPTQSNSISTADANYADSVGNVTAVGAYFPNASHYGTLDQGGNIWEWTDEIVNPGSFASSRVREGGAFNSADADPLNSLSGRTGSTPTYEWLNTGFRVSSLSGPSIVPVPEPSTYVLVAFGALALTLALKRRKGRD